jgi:hypothetical protein
VRPPFTAAARAPARPLACTRTGLRRGLSRQKYQAQACVPRPGGARAVTPRHTLAGILPPRCRAARVQGRRGRPDEGPDAREHRDPAPGNCDPLHLAHSPCAAVFCANERAAVRVLACAHTQARIVRSSLLLCSRSTATSARSRGNSRSRACLVFCAHCTNGGLSHAASLACSCES